MAYASQSGRAKTSSSSPQAFAICDRCGFTYNHVNLQWQFDWRGPTLQNVRILVCGYCLDDPQEQQRAIVLPADPDPIMNARVQSYLEDETTYRVTASIPTTDPVTGLPVYSSEYLVTTDNQNLTTQPIGSPTGIKSTVSMQAFGGDHYFPTLSVLSLFGDGYNTVTATCSVAHGLEDNSQVTVQGSTSDTANGSFSISISSAMAFTYLTNTVIPAGSLLTGATLVYPVDIGLPLGYIQLPQTGI
jgi:hypothetical protein